MNEIYLSGTIKDIEPSHEIDTISFSKAKLITKRDNGQEDVINLRFKSFSNKYNNGDTIRISGNVRSYSQKVGPDKNKVTIYVFTYFDDVDEQLSNNIVKIDGRICKLNDIRHNRSGKDNIHFIVANNLVSGEGSRRLNSYIPCIAWGTVAKQISELSVSTRVMIDGELHSREHKKVYPDGTVEFRVAHELLVKDLKVIE